MPRAVHASTSIVSVPMIGLVTTRRRGAASSTAAVIGARAKMPTSASASAAYSASVRSLHANPASSGTRRTSHPAAASSGATSASCSGSGETTTTGVSGMPDHRYLACNRLAQLRDEPGALLLLEPYLMQLVGGRGPDRHAPPPVGLVARHDLPVQVRHLIAHHLDVDVVGPANVHERLDDAVQV